MTLTWSFKFDLSSKHDLLEPESDFEFFSLKEFVKRLKQWTVKNLYIKLFEKTRILKF